jgi:hypothetical protein
MANGWSTLNILFQEICNSIKMLRNFILIGLGGAIGSVLLEASPLFPLFH